MRGKIIQYNGADGSGTIVVDGRQHPFVLAAWRGDSAPALNKTVEVAFDGDTISTITAVGDDVLLKEKAAELGGKLGSLWNKVPAAAGVAPANDGSAAGAAPSAAPGAANGGAALAGTILQRYGKGILIAWAMFLIATTLFNAISIQTPFGGASIGKSLFDIASLLSQFGVNGGGSIKLLLILGYLSIGVPLVWRDRRAWLTLGIPLLAMLWATYSAIHSVGSIGGMAGGDGPSAFDFIGFGFYLAYAAAIVLGVLAFKRFSSAS